MLPVAIVLPSGDQLTTNTQLEWPFSERSGVPVSQSHIRAVLSPLPLAIRDEDTGENCAARTASLCPLMAAEHLDTGRTRKTASGAHGTVMVASLLARFGRKTDS
jgi:hypothetical protein